ncbi:ABC transporter, solute-binding protein [Marvinbryantia formatexigens DSM 14469]|uniref:ABC transporter, solute-binding protein n=1 Tax=Marvinbryantia formatexigens DSM 14469 TaxID=478749 RepID=C6LGW8_9FIRM|nr:extracellular solute-binding protein [Marvinbryantia formatexigens]EET60027.1 ABC transporter, solute-binding protein [Marvinbryantia formatexigens DSM 14469]UWO23828.1 extracellular solute-binding protein [Marvinbryantia formatexigens DSM 14469]SDF72675.1 multiple sugar transport system substrate-binding protein [Marvinbryantia formatexigens]
MKKIIAVLPVVCMVLLCGCNQKDARNLPPAGKETEKIVIWSYYETQAQREGLDELVRSFNQSQNEYRAEWEYVPMTGFVKGLSSAYTENDLPDMAIIDNPDMAALIQMGLFEDITLQAQEWELENECYPSMLETLKYEGKYYGIPFNCNSTALIYNKELFAEYHLTPPETWEELREAAKKLTTPERSGFAMCCIESEQGAFQILPWILAAGEDPQSLGGEATVEAFAFLKSLLLDGSMSENCINLTQTDLALEFAEGRAAIIQNGPWVFPQLDEAGIDYGIVPVPGRERNNAVVGGENIGILKGKNLEGSLAFLRFCIEGDEITEFCRKASVLPAKISAARESVEKRPELAVFQQQMENAVTRTSIPHWSAVSGKLSEGIYRIISQEETPQQAAAALQEN